MYILGGFVLKILIVLFFSILVLSGCGHNEDYALQDSYNNSSYNNTTNDTNTTNKITADEFPKPQELAETNLCSFSTKVSQKDPNRQTNITIACESLNGITVKARRNFFFL